MSLEIEKKRVVQDLTMRHLARRVQVGDEESLKRRGVG